MKVVKLRKQHVERLKEFNSDKFPFPDLNNPLYIINGSVMDDGGNLIGAGFIKLTSEAIIVLDPKLDKFKKASAIMSLFNSARKGMINKGIDGVHAFTNDPSFARFLKKRFGFEECDRALYLRLNG